LRCRSVYGFPVNFRSPYKAASVIDFWRRWRYFGMWQRMEFLYFRF
jgi:D-alanyl-lipoteichoic acid acyltransferase DltB (MBOAT superfamily)